VKGNRFLFILGVIVLAVVIGGCNSSQPGSEETGESIDQTPFATSTPDPVPPTEEVQPTATVEDKAHSSPTRLVNFDQLGISLEVPSELYVSKDPIVNLDDPSKLESYLFYIQNYGHPGGSSSGDFQMYGHLQYDLPSVTWEEFASGQIDSTMNAYANEIEINGLRGFDTQLSGQRNRFVYHFFLNGQILSIAVSEPNEENKAVADQIIQTQ
jgi:hypothetical protein